jgi:rhodanese-related sulfurtransferase
VKTNLQYELLLNKKHHIMKPLNILSFFIIPLGFIIAAVPANTTHQQKLAADQILKEVSENVQFISPDEVADMIVRKDPLLQIIDVRTPEEFSKFSLPGAVNIPLSNLLAPEYKDILDQDSKTNVFFSNGTTQSSEAWLITRQLGYQNNYALQGGLNYWAETIMNPQKPASASPDDELAKYDFRKGASMVLGGGAVQPTQTSSDVKAPTKPAMKNNKKRVQGGC